MRLYTLLKNIITKVNTVSAKADSADTKATTAQTRADNAYALAETARDKWLVATVTSSEMTVSGNTWADHTIPISRTGYTPMGVVSYRQSDGSNFTLCYIISVRTTSTSCVIRLRNTTSSTATMTWELKILYQKGTASSLPNGGGGSNNDGEPVVDGENQNGGELNG